MVSRPRPSLLALFDPLAISEIPSSASTHGSHSPSPSLESDSDKENSTSTTLKGGWTKACVERVSDIQSACDVGLLVGMDVQRDHRSDLDLLGQSFSLEPKGDDSSNLCRVELRDELDKALDVAGTEDGVQCVYGRRVPLSEVSLMSLNSNTRTPQSVARAKKLIDLDTPSATPKSTRKIVATAAGRRDVSTKSVVASLSSRSPLVRAARRTPSNVTASASVHPAPQIPFASDSPSFLSSTPAPDPKPAFHDPPSEHVSSSFEILHSPRLKKSNFSGDLLNDDLSFLERLEDDSYADFERGNEAATTSSTSSETPQDTVKSVDQQNSGATQETSVELQENYAKTLTPVRKPSSVFRRSSSHRGLTFGARREELSMVLSSPVNLESRTPSSSPSAPAMNRRSQPLAPKKAQTVIRRSNTLSQSVAGTIKEQSETKADGLQYAKSGRLRPRPSSLEIKPNTRTLSVGIRKPDMSLAANDAPVPGRRTSISRPSLGRRPSVGKSLSPTRAKASESRRNQDGENQKRPATVLGQNARRLSVSASSKPTPIKTNTFATTGRLGAARRVPFTANARLFKSNEPTITEARSPKPVQRAASVQSKGGPIRPPISGVSGTVGRSATKPKATSPERTDSSISSKSRTLGRTMSTSSGLFSRSSFMTSSSSSMVSTSRLPIPPSKSTSRISGPGTRKPF